MGAGGEEAATAMGAAVAAAVAGAGAIGCYYCC